MFIVSLWRERTDLRHWLIFCGALYNIILQFVSSISLSSSQIKKIVKPSLSTPPPCI